MTFRRVVFLLFVCFVGCYGVSAQGVCVIGEKTLFEFKGTVTQDDQQPIPNASVKLYKQSYEKKPLAQVKTDLSGKFILQKLVDGKYIVNVSYPNFVTLVFPVRVSKKAGVAGRELIIIPGWNYDESCGGGSVKQIVHEKGHIENDELNLERLSVIGNNIKIHENFLFVPTIIEKPFQRIRLKLSE